VWHHPTTPFCTKQLKDAIARLFLGLAVIFLLLAVAALAMRLARPERLV